MPASNPNAGMGGDKFAARYCFRARCRVVCKRTGTLYGTFTSYDKTPSISADVMHACETSLAAFPEGSWCSPDIDLTMFTECPVECTREVLFQAPPPSTSMLQAPPLLDPKPEPRGSSDGSPSDGGGAPDPRP